jgi:hypothetical protein
MAWQNYRIKQGYAVQAQKASPWIQAKKKAARRQLSIYLRLNQ